MEILKNEVKRPFSISGNEGKYDVIALVNGGGTTGQAGALRHGISRALCQADPENRPFSEGCRLPHKRPENEGKKGVTWLEEGKKSFPVAPRDNRETDSKSFADPEIHWISGFFGLYFFIYAVEIR